MTYAELKSAIADFLNRQDLTSVIPTFIQLAEASINRTVRHRRMLSRATATLTTQFTDLPDDFLEAKNIQINSEPITPLSFVTMEHADLLRAGIYQSAGKPKYYTLVGDTIEVVPNPDAEYTIELSYYARVPVLSEAAPTNWLLDNSPDAYLYGALIHSAPYLKDDPRIPVWVGLFEKVMSDFVLETQKTEFSGSALVQRTKSWQ
jgi:hypothetical protein